MVEGSDGKARDCRHYGRGYAWSPVFRPQVQSDPWMTSAGHLTSWNIQIRAVMTRR